MKNMMLSFLWMYIFACTPTTKKQTQEEGIPVEQKPVSVAPKTKTSQKPSGLYNFQVACCVDSLRQSPINIPVKGTPHTHTIDFHYVNSHEVIENLGHTVELLYDKGSQVFFDEKEYALVQFHFHTPSEHRVNEKGYPMEMHMVHQAPDSSFLVVGLFFEEKEENTFLKEFIKDIPEKEGETMEGNKDINLRNIFPAEKSFYTYPGSLTTPPYTENVRWVLFKNPVPLSLAQLEVFQKLEGFNARDAQPLNHRQVEEFSK